MAELSPLRRRMIEDMTIRNLSPATQRSYVMRLRSSAAISAARRSGLDLEDVRAFQVHLVSTGISWPALNQIVCAPAVLLRRHARRGGDPGADRLRARAAQAAGGAERRRGRAVSRSGVRA